MNINWRRVRNGKYRYELEEMCFVQTPIRGHYVVAPYIALYETGVLLLFKGYQSDGPSGPTIRTRIFIDVSFPHDAFYQLLRLGLLPQECRDAIDQFLRDQYTEAALAVADDKVRYLPRWLTSRARRTWTKARGAWIYWGVRKFGARYAAQGEQSDASKNRHG